MKILVDSQGKPLFNDGKAYTFSTDNQPLNLVSGQGKYEVKFIDYDGTVLKVQKVNVGDLVSLPIAPEHGGLVFDDWSCSEAIVDNKIEIPNNNVICGAMYHTASAAIEARLCITKVTGLSVTFASLNGMTSIDWGDGSTDSLLTHTYNLVGDYNVKIYGVAGIGASAFLRCSSLVNIALPAGIAITGNQIFSWCQALKTVVIPSTTTISDTCSLFGSCNSLTGAVLPNGIQNKIVDSSAFLNCYSLSSLVIPASVSKIGNNAFQGCNSLTNFAVPSSVTQINSYSFYECKSLPGIITTAELKGSSIFTNCFACLNFDFSFYTAVPVLNSQGSLTGINKAAKIKVPAALYDTWKATTNWSYYANYIIAV